MNKTQPVTLFIQCLIDGMYPEIGDAIIKLFQKLNIPVDCPSDQTCCGQVAYNSGYQKEAAVAAKRFIRLFENAEVIVCPSGSCVDMVRHNYLALFKEDAVWFKRAQEVSSKIFEFTEYLVDVLGLEDVGARYDGKITYHDSCHLLRNLHVESQPRKLIEHVKGATLVEMQNSDKCCGFGGMFSVKYSDISSAILEDKVNNIIASGADTVVGCDISCLMNIQGMLSRKNVSINTLHIAQLLTSE
jgi:L-lactate dehydrogenase complex protein LldE